MSNHDTAAIDEIWKDDLLNRQQEALHLIRFLENKYRAESTKPFVFNIDSSWGHGKTFFIRGLSKQLRLHNYPVVVFDAWHNDFSNDALLSFVSEVCLSLENELSSFSVAREEVSKLRTFSKSLIKDVAPILAAVAAKKITGHSLDELSEMRSDDGDLNNDNGDLENLTAQIASITTTNAMKQYGEKKKATEGFLESLAKIVNRVSQASSKELPIFIFVDELDRCRPIFSIQLLESIKHLFAVSGVYFIVSTDTEQLCHSIRSVYGTGFDANRYLKRFFDMEYRLEEPDNYALVNYLFEISPIGERLFVPQGMKINAVRLFTDICEFFKLGARDIEQVFSIVKSAVYLVESPLHLIYLLFVVCFKHLYPNEFVSLQAPVEVNVVKELLVKLARDGKINESAKYRYYSSQGDTYRFATLKDLFLTYCELTRVFQGLGEYISNHDLDQFDHEIAVRLYEDNRDGKTNCYGDIVRNISDSTLVRYHDLIFRAGNFSTN